EFIPVSLDAESGAAVSFRYRTLQAAEANCENAEAGKHYIDEATDVLIPPGVTQTNLPVRIIGNNKDEFPGKRFYVKFDIPVNVSVPGDVEVGILDYNMDRMAFNDNFEAGTGNWTVLGGAAWSLSGGIWRLNAQGIGGRALVRRMFKQDDFAVRAMMMNEVSWQNWGLYACNRESTGGGNGYKFTFTNSGSPWTYNGRLYADGIQIAGTTGSSDMMGGARAGYVPFMRPLAMRVTKTPEGHNRIRCWAGFYNAIDHIDESGSYPDGGQIGITGEGWGVTHWDKVEIFVREKTTIVIIK
ncbi:MAG: hypothetical protein FWG05_03460, partial [Kiritimatiellaeota bacterium]|nr:hypothetical protein [Kiritimatiellota bacterium]